MQTPGSSFLHERNPNLHTSVEVESVAGYLRAGGEAIPNEPADKISAYLGFLVNREYVNDGILTGDQGSIDRQIDSAIIAVTPENAHAFAKFESKIAREEGIRFDPEQLPDDTKMERLRIQHEDQRKQLREWVSYLKDQDTKYPDWFKYYAFESVKGLTKFDEDKQSFGKRSANSFALYPELDRESLAVVYDVVKRKLEGNTLGGFTPEMQKAALAGNFAKLYTEANKLGFAISPELKQNLDGAWRHYGHSDSIADSDLLADDIAKYRTGWCTAGRETAHRQLAEGDFYVFYTPDKHGRKNVPRVAIRMERGKVREIRGVNSKQNMEMELADVVLERVKDLPGGEEYIRKAEDMKRLTTIEKKIAANSEADLTSDELRFLYELDHEIQGFGYETDPRISEIRSQRGDRDKPELARILPESIREQVKTTYLAYRTVADKLQGAKRGLFGKREVSASPQELEALFAAKDKEWQANGTYDYLVEQLIESGARFNLVATPNIEASEAVVVALAEDFGKEQPYPTRVNNDLYRKGHYSGREWSGNKGNAPIRISLIPSRGDSEISYTSVTGQVRLLRERQASRPELSARVPSLLDAVTYWYSLRAGGDKLDDSSAFDKTYIRHFDLEPKTVGGWLICPYSYVYIDGRPNLSGSYAGNGNVARLAVG